MPTSRDPFEKFLRQLTPLMESQKFPSLKKSRPLYESLEIACVAARHGSEWILISGRADLKTESRVPHGRLEPLVRLRDLVALQGRVPAERVKNLVADLRDSWVVRGLKRDNVRLRAKRARGYCWMPPYVIKSSESIWRRAFALHGNGPGISSLLSDSAMQEIDSRLRSSTPAFDGLEGLCNHLGLPAWRSSLRSSFQLSAELPAYVVGADFEPCKCSLLVTISGYGVPQLMVEWLPQYELQRVPDDWIAEQSSEHFVRIEVGPNPTAAKLILSFGELQADVSTIDLDTVDFCRGGTDPFQLDVVPEEPTVPGFATRGVPDQKPPNLTYESEIKQEILRVLTWKRHASDLEVCQELDKRELELPRGWKKDSNTVFFGQAYRDPGIKHRVEERISSVRTDMRKRGIL